MNQGFRLRYDELKENDPGAVGEQTTAIDQSSRYSGNSYARSVCFVWPDGRKVLLNYAYFTGAEFDTSSEKNAIKLDFSSTTVLLAGYRLEGLFMQFMEHIPRIVEAVDERYVLIETTDTGFVTDIIVEKNS